jgi:peptidylamidoglycolate lyase
MQNHILSPIGHNSFQYTIVPEWGKLNQNKYPVKDCHEMVMDKSGRLYMLTNNITNNILVYDKSGNLLDAWGTSYNGGHGLSISDENGEEFLFITDYERHEVIKTTMNGKEVMVLSYPIETGVYQSAEQYNPTETAIAPNGDIYVTDGYGLQYVIQYNHRGEYIRHWGGKGNRDEQFDCVHGIAFDNRQKENPVLLITSRNHCALKKFTLTGEYLDTIHLPGSFVCRPIIKGENVYAAVFRSGHNENYGSGYITILNKNNEVISTPDASAPEYINGKLQEQRKTGSLFIHPHDICVDDEDNLYVPQWDSNQTYPIKLELIK